MFFYKMLLLVVVNLGLYFLVKKNFPQINKQVFGLIIVIGLATGSVLDYLLFKNQVLNKIGNLRLMWRFDNGEKSNEIISLKDYSNFNTYKQISLRSNELANSLISNEMFELTK